MPKEPRVRDYVFGSPVGVGLVVGGPEPEVFIERGGVQYFSHIDGKEISDFVKNAEFKK